ncbi:MAG: selenium cofactor biosynthesis protein YqeC [Syntrophorhabdaceae bacterium]|nr:selenium cofactor biosynthesis protein YqeC [Syntrophorhabdaceae bacterium]
MWIYKRVDLKDEIEGLKYLSFVGAGGKTSLIKYLASEIARTGKKVAITTTTKIYAERPYRLLEERETGTDNGNPIFIGKSIENGKLTALNEDEIENIAKEFDVVFIEADGAKRKPLKFPEAFEPVIIDRTEKVFIVAGLDALYKKIKDTVFRWHIFCEKTGLSGDEVINPEIFLMFFSPDGLLKDIGRKEFHVILNKYDLCIERNMAFHIAKNLIKRIKPDRIYVASINYGAFYKIDTF